ncbi:MAG: hypothetical protein JXA57_07540 [Armatimonadetes bacterium]|nr:hypothetical protein [Armatimonadota bacterium]
MDQKVAGRSITPLISDVVAFHFDTVEFRDSTSHIHPFYQLDLYLDGDLTVILRREDETSTPTAIGVAHPSPDLSRL